MSRNGEVVIRNALLWAHTPIRKMHGGMRIRDGKIVEIFHHGREKKGTDAGVDLGGRHVIPGLIDAHRHFFISAMGALHGDAGQWTSRHDALAAIGEACRAHRPGGGWVFFSGMDHTGWKIPSPPTLEEIDAVAKGAPVLVADISCHRGVISTEALRRAGLKREALRCPGDMDIRRDGSLKGLIWEDALGRVLFTMCRDVLAACSDEEKRKIILDEADRCLKMGLTHVHDPGIPFDVQRLMKDAQKDTPLKMSWSVTAHEGLCAPPQMRDHEEACHSDHAPRSVKFFLDGAHRTAASMPPVAGLKAAYRAALDSVSGGSLWPLRMLFEQKTTLRGGRIVLPYQRFADTGELVGRAGFFTEKGYRLVMHALGNVAAVQASEVVKELGMAGLSSIEHLLVMDDASMDAFASCGAVASIQPGFIPGYADAIERMEIFPYLKAFPLRSLSSRGVPVCISSDGPCGADDPLHNIRRAADREKYDGTMLDPDERISEEMAMAAGSLGGSVSLGIQNEGLSEGAPATFCIVSGDPFEESSRIAQTWIDGEKVG